MNKLIFFIAIFLSFNVFAGDNTQTEVLKKYETKQEPIQERVSENLKRDKVCTQKINRYNDRIAKYSGKDHPSAADKIKIVYYKDRLKFWRDYCNGKSPSIIDAD